MEHVASDALAVGVSVNVPVPGDRSIVFQTHFPQTSSSADINKLLDTLTTAADRQVAKYTLPLLEAQLEVEKQQVDRIGTDLARVDARYEKERQNATASGRRKTVVSEKEQAERANVEATKHAFKKAVDRLEKQIADCRTKIDGVDIGADR